MRPSPQFFVENLYNFAVIGAVKDSDERRCENATRRQMARHPQPREVAELKGATRVHPERYRKQPPEVAHELGEAPAHLSAEAQRCWFEIATYAPVGVLKGADRLSLEVLSNLLAEYRGDPEAFAVGKYTHLVGLLARLGMSPADRQKLGAEKPPEGNEFDEF